MLKRLRDNKQQQRKEGYNALDDLNENKNNVTKNTSMAVSRVLRDLDELDVDETAVKLHFPNPMNVLQIKLELYVREGIWAGATFEFSFDIPDSYPFKPPVVICLNKIFHPNVDVLGNVCLNLLREDWNPVRDINQCIWGIQQLFDSPNPIDPLNKDAATLLRDNPYMFSRVVRSTLSGEMYQNETYSKLI